MGRKAASDMYQKSLFETLQGSEILTFSKLADVTEGFSGADIAEICQRAAKNAIKESIHAGIALQRRVDSGSITQAEADAADDPCPHITKAHFEASMSKARRSVTPEVMKQYTDFEAKIKQQWNTDKGEEGGGEGGGDGAAQEEKGDMAEYDIDEAERRFREEDAAMGIAEDELEEENDEEEAAVGA